MPYVGRGLEVLIRFNNPSERVLILATSHKTKCDTPPSTRGPALGVGFHDLTGRSLTDISDISCGFVSFVVQPISLVLNAFFLEDGALWWLRTMSDALTRK